MAFWFRPTGRRAGVTCSVIFGVNSNWEAWRAPTGSSSLTWEFDWRNRRSHEQQIADRNRTAGITWPPCSINSTGAFQLYVNGVLDASSTATIASQAAALLTIGTSHRRHRALTSRGDRRLSHLRSHNHRRGGDRRALWPHGPLEADRDERHDCDRQLGPRRSTGTYTNSPTLAQAGPYPGAGANAASFDGTNDYVNGPVATNYTLEEGFSIAGWVYLNAYID